MTRLWAIAAVTVVAVVACDRVPLTSPTGSTISLSVDKESLPVGGTATVIAVVTESSGTAVHNGTMVTFQTTSGRMDPIEAPTVNGKATSTFIGAGSGTAVIHAFSGPARTGSGNSSAGGVSVKVGTAAAERVSVRTEPISIPVTGGTVTVIAGLFDGGGNPISNTPVSISADFGTLSATSATTDANGEARVSLTTNRTTVITVTAGTKKEPVTLTALNPPTVTLTCGATGNTAATAGVPISCTIAATASGSTTSTAPVVNVTVNWGDGSGEQPLGVNGSTTVSHTFTSPGQYAVTAAATDANSQRGTAVLTLNVTRSLPTLTTFTVPSTATVGVPVAMSVTPPTSPTLPIQNVRIEFGDNTFRDLGAINGQTGFTKTYSSAGGYTVTANVTDSTGQQGRLSAAIIVSQAAAATITFTNTTTGGEPLKAGTNETFSVSATAGTGAPAITNVKVTIQDGEVLYNGSNPGSFAWRPNSAGTVTFTIVATDSSGQTFTLVKTMTVDP